MEIIEQIFFNSNDHTQLIVDGKTLKSITTLEELKETMKSAYVGENDDMIIYHTFLKYVEQYDKKTDGFNDTETWEQYCVYVVNKHDLADCNWVTSNRAFDNIYIGKTMIIANSMPFLIEEESKTFAFIKDTIDFYGDERVDNQIRDILDKVNNYTDLEEACSLIDDIKYWANIEEMGEEVFIDMTLYTRGKKVTLEMITDLTKYMDSFQEIKEWSDVTENNLNLENILYETIRILSQRRETSDIKLNHLIGLLDNELLDMNINWDDVDDGKTTVEKEIINSLVTRVKEEKEEERQRRMEKARKNLSK